MKLRTRIMLLCGATLLGLLILSAVALNTLYSSLMKERTSHLTTLVELAQASAQKAYDREKAGQISHDEAMAEAKRAIGSFHKDTRYFFVLGYSDDVNYVHPDAKRVGIVDANGGRESGVRNRDALKQAAQQGQTLAFTSGKGMRPGTDGLVDKLYGITRFEPFDWIIGTGDYIDDIQQTFWRNALMLLALVAVLILATTLLAWNMLRTLLRQLGGEPQYAVEVVREIADGNLTVEVQTRPGDDSSILFAISAMRNKLADLVSQVRSSTHSITTASMQIASGNEDLSSRTESQASALQETAAAMEQLTSTVHNNAENARNANTLAQSASDVAIRGGDVVKQVVNTMDSINGSSRKVVDIIGVIDSIAFQTNILALNAAVEAARAGEQGRGFAVVATEVRTLAQRSASAAKEIKGLIDDSVSKVDEGTTLVKRAGVTMSEVVESVQRVTATVAEISAASAEQSSGIEQVNLAVAQMDQSTEQNAALVQEALAAAKSLSDQAQGLSRTVAQFRVDDGTDTLPTLARLN
ncbi:methyl-accepting chemotaxis protein [Candidatus Symbiopectobacterium sp. NZEC135]|uniref:methyl-accepting chemotaxis protein n=1 Tax=Candidatus Symbiopectobacterium sp. NZEC135 TaxID=2820471 RepID=UPI002227B83E|nr:methyl-accepting chemotaxis protein [Candidatus Symbiopectobacterium sp. NZEC135]MCW2479367.1 cache domain-containing protein [Candidatus Symbiopectobacterium sp. NZEC135]